MTIRIGIELSAAASRFIEIEGRWRPESPDRPPRVRSFAVLPPSGRDTDDMLASLKGRDAAIVVWGAPSEHRQVAVDAGSYETMRRDAVGALAGLEPGTGTVLADVVPVHGATGRRRSVILATAAAEPMLAAMGPLTSAGIHVRAIATPGMALAALAFSRRGMAGAGGVEAYIAVEETSSCIALLRDGALAMARELPWGYIARGVLRPREDIAKRVARELEQYLEAVGAPAASQVCICGGVPELRTISALLTDQLDVEVEPLDSLFGIDESALPEPASDFRDRAPELRLAWAVAAEWPLHLNLLRARRREESRRALAAAAVAAGVVAGVAGAWAYARTDRFAPSPSASASQARRPARSAPAPQPARPAPAIAPPTATVAPPTAAAAPPAVAPRPSISSRSIVPPSAAIALLVRPPQTTPLPAPEPPPSPAPTAPVTTATAPPATAAPLPRAAAAPQPPASAKPSPASTTQRVAAAAPPPALTPPPSAAAKPSPTSAMPSTVAPKPPLASQPPHVASQAPPPLAQKAPPPREASPVQRVVPPPAATAAPPPLVRPGAAGDGSRVEPPRPDRRSPAASRSRSGASARAALPAPESFTAFDAALSTILYSADRKLAIVDGRIVGVGDLVRGARIVEILPDAIMLRDDRGRLRRLGLSGNPR